jgi:hypothetical protein
MSGLDARASLRIPLLVLATIARGPSLLQTLTPHLRRALQRRKLKNEERRALSTWDAMG